MAYDPLPLIFGKLYCKFFVMDTVAFMQGVIGHIQGASKKLPLVKIGRDKYYC